MTFRIEKAVLIGVWKLEEFRNKLFPEPPEITHTGLSLVLAL